MKEKKLINWTKKPSNFFHDIDDILTFGHVFENKNYSSKKEINDSEFKFKNILNDDEYNEYVIKYRSQIENFLINFKASEILTIPANFHKPIQLNLISENKQNWFMATALVALYSGVNYIHANLLEQLNIKFNKYPIEKTIEPDKVSSGMVTIQVGIGFLISNVEFEVVDNYFCCSDITLSHITLKEFLINVNNNILEQTELAISEWLDTKTSFELTKQNIQIDGLSISVEKMPMIPTSTTLEKMIAYNILTKNIEEESDNYNLIKFSNNLYFKVNHLMLYYWESVDYLDIQSNIRSDIFVFTVSHKKTLSLVVNFLDSKCSIVVPYENDIQRKELIIKCKNLACQNKQVIGNTLK